MSGCHKGVPLTIHSDADQEFLGGVTKALATILGCKQTTSKAHNPMANSKIERVWAFVALCLRQMTDSQYENFHLYTPIMAHIWNTSTDSDTGISPFQAEHGIQARTPASSFWDKPPSKSSIATPEGLSATAQSAHAFRKLLAQAKANRKAMVAAKLNSSGRSKVTYQVGDAVAFYLPPTQEQAEKANRNHKHLTQWAGPGYITKCLSANGTTFRIRCGNTNYERHVLNMRKWKGPAPPIPKGICLLYTSPSPRDA